MLNYFRPLPGWWVRWGRYAVPAVAYLAVLVAILWACFQRD